jgi:hypothetical protein
MPSKAAADLARLRWKNKSAEDRRETMARARAARDMSPEARAEMGRRLTAARAAKRAKPQAE